MKGIYQIKNKINNKIYVGSSINIKTRWTTHKNELRNNKKENPYLQNSWNKYGEDNFVFEILLLCEEFELEYYEQWYLDNVVCWGIDYNIAECAEASMRGRTHTEESKRKMSIAKSGENNPRHGVDCSGKRGGMYGKAHTEETKKKISKALSRENNPFYGKNHTEETKLKICENNPNAKLIKEKVLMLRRMYLTGKYTQLGLASLFDVSQPQVSLIVNRKTWRHI